MNILLFSYYYPPAVEVGSRRPSKLVEEFLRYGDNVRVVANQGFVPPQTAIPSKNFDVTRVSPFLRPLKGVDMFSRIWNKLLSRYLSVIDPVDWWLPSALRASSGMIKYNKPDVI